MQSMMQTSFAVTALYAGLLGLVFIVLSFRVVRLRGKHRVDLGDGGVDELVRAVRVHGNFAEYVPLALVLMLLAEGAGAADGLLHGLGILLVLARLSHAHALFSGTMATRVFGAGSTNLVIVISAVMLIGRSVGAF